MFLPTNKYKYYVSMKAILQTHNNFSKPLQFDKT